MEIYAAGQHAIQPRLKFDQLYSSKPLTKPIAERRLRIVADTSIRGQPVFVGSVFQFDTAMPDFHEDYGLLLSGLKAERVSNDTPLVTVPAPESPKKK